MKPAYLTELRFSAFKSRMIGTRWLMILPLIVTCAAESGCSDNAGASGSKAPTAPASPEGQKIAASDAGESTRSSKGRQPVPAGAVPVEFDPPALDLGLMSPGDSRDGTARMRNIGSAPLRIIASGTSCRCTVVNLANKVIPPGESIEFTAGMKPKSGLGEKQEGIRIAFEGYERPVQYMVKAEVSLPIRAMPPHLTASESLTGQIVIASMDGKPFTVLATHGKPPQFVGFNPGSDAPRAEYTLRWDLTPFAAAIPWWWVIETDRKDCPVVDVRVRHDSTKPEKLVNRVWVQEDQRILAGELGTGQSLEFTTVLEWPLDVVPDDLPQRVVSQSPLFEATLLRAEPAGNAIHCTIRITIKDAAPGLLYGTMRLHTARASCPLTIIGRVVEPQSP